MKLRFLLFLAAVFFFFSSFIHAENSADSVTSDTKKDKVKTGWNFGGLPVLGYDSDMESPHLAFGGGFRIVMNQNFIICADYGQAMDRRDGSNGIYIGLGYLF